MNHGASEALCARCAWASGCTIPGDMDAPIVTCKRYAALETRWGDPVAESPRPDPGRMEGLCVDCENRVTCVFRKREGGTWHCEEYC